MRPSLSEKTAATTAPTVTPSPADGYGLAARFLFSALEGMRAGRLEMTLPDGALRAFGEGRETTASIVVRDPAFFKKCLLRGDIGFAEAYMDGDWDTGDIAAVIGWFLLNADDAPTLSGSRARAGALGLLRFIDRAGHLLRPNSRRGARRNIADHYDLSNEFFGLWLDHSMFYSSALFTRPEMDLGEAQTAKAERLCRLLRLRPGDRVLEIGCGWGGFALYAAREYGVHVTGLTISERQAERARARADEAGLAHLVDIRLADFREFTGQFDRIVSIEMMEALGHANQPAFTAACDRLLKPGGLAALQFITVPDARYDDLRKGVDFIQKHIFPGSLLLSLNRVNTLFAGSGRFVLTDLKDLSADYAETLRRWAENFEARRDAVLALGFAARFLRKWRYYLRYCEAAFAARHIGVVQALYTRPNNPTLGGPSR